jgi:hypothetical protein
VGFRLEKKGPGTVVIGAAPGATGAGHLHTIGGGDTLSRGSDLERFSGFEGDVERMRDLMSRLADAGDDVSNFMTVLGTESGDVLAWYGKNLDGEGKKIESVRCK